jgi:hypothetical protein
MSFQNVKYPNMEYILHVCPNVQQKYDLPNKIKLKQYENYTILPFLQSKYPDVAQLKTLLNRPYNLPDEKVYQELISEITCLAKLEPIT